MKKAKIRGTEFELRDYENDGDRVWFSVPGGMGYRHDIPAEWVEFYDPPREEPPEGSVELDVDNLVWQRMGNRWIMAGSGEYAVVWNELQEIYGPTKSMKVDE